MHVVLYLCIGKEIHLLVVSAFADQKARLPNTDTVCTVLQLKVVDGM